jgi:hypothetical protein
MSKFSRLAAIIAVAALLLPNLARAADFSSYQWYGNAFHIEISGPIVAGDNDRFRRLVLSEIRSGHIISAIQLDSPGGDVDQALGMGRAIRQLNASTFAPSVRSGERVCLKGSLDSESREDPSSCECASACSLIWVAGVGRLGDLVGVHRPRFDEDFYKGLTPDEATKRYSQLFPKMSQYFAEMGVPEWLNGMMYSVPSSDMHYLTAPELQQFTNSSPALGELIIARCHNAPGGTIYSNPQRKAYADCTFDINMYDVIKGNRDFLAAAGNDNDKALSLAWAAPMIQVQRPTVTAPAPTTYNPPASTPDPSPPQIETSVAGPSFDCQSATAPDEQTIWPPDCHGPAFGRAVRGGQIDAQFRFHQKRTAKLACAPKQLRDKRRLYLGGV